MNVNPFSYLIEKLKSKVSKSGDTMSGNLTIQENDERYVKCANTGKSTAVFVQSANDGSHGIYSNGYYDGSFHSEDKWLLVRAGNNKVYVNGSVVPYGGELALKSDYGAKTVVETRHDIVFNNSDTSNWINPPSAISSKTIYAMVFSSLDGGGGLVTREAGGSNRFAIRWSATITATLNARLVWFYTD